MKCTGPMLYINSDWLQIREFPEKADYARRHHVSATAVLTFGNKDISWLETSAFSTSVLWLFFPLWNFPRKQVNLMCYTLDISNNTIWMPGDKGVLSALPWYGRRRMSPIFTIGHGIKHVLTFSVSYYQFESSFKFSYRFTFWRNFNTCFWIVFLIYVLLCHLLYKVCDIIYHIVMFRWDVTYSVCSKIEI